MTTDNTARFIVCLLSISYITCNEKLKNECPEATGCECVKAWTSIARKTYGEKVLANCHGSTNPKLEFLPKQNLARVALIRNTFTNVSMLNELRDTTAFRFSFIENKFPKETPLFNWDWLPRTTTNLSFVANGFRGFQARHPSNNCRPSGFRNKLSLLVEDEEFVGIPNCLPSMVNIISLKNLPELESKEEIEWPKDMTLLKIIGGDFGQHSSKYFENTPSSLVTLWLSEQTFVNSSWVKQLPANTLETLIITQSNIRKLPEIEKFEKANVLHTLTLSFNRLTDVPKNLPVSLHFLRLDNNNIRYIPAERWSSLKNLTLLDLSKNNLLAVPLGMPSTLKRLYLTSNDIHISSEIAFQHLGNLEILDLSYNKLSRLPKGIQPGLKNYIVSKNQISLVMSSNEYNFCMKCRNIQLNGNPWHCDINMMKMLNWLVLHNVTMQDLGLESSDKEDIAFCNQFGFQGGVDSSWFQSVMEFMEYFRKPPFHECIYEIQSLKCINANLLQLPVRIPPGMEMIEILDNPELETIPDYVFFNQTALRQLRLNNNSLSHVPIGLPSSLQSLSMNDNKLGNWTNEDLYAFKNLTLLRYLYLADNNIRVLYAWQFEGLNDLEWIGLAGNPLHCDCSMQSFSYYFEQIVPRNPRVVYRHYPMCKTPLDHKNVDIRQLTGYYSYGIQCIPQKCGYNHSSTHNSGGILNCSKAFQNDETKSYIYGFVPGEEISVPSNTYWIQLDLSGLELRLSQINYKNLSRVEIVDLSGNLLNEIPLERLPTVVKFLNLSGNEITVLPSHDDILQYFPNIHTLDLSFNQIRMITSQVSNFQVISSLLLYGNPLICNCTSTSLGEWIRINIGDADMVNRHQLKKLTCELQGKQQIRKIYKIKDTDYCPPQPVALILGTIAAIVVFLLLAIVLGNVYYHRKHREKVNEEILLGFQNLLEKEIDVEDPETGISKQYKFDAFVSYDPNGLDAEFVLSLLEELEDKRGYRLCLSERDFIPGAGITDNIVECIGESKHVVLVLSHSFIASPWCQCEVQAALTELHQRRRSQLLISVLLEDISGKEDTARNVKTLLSLAPGLNAPRYMPDEGKEWQAFWNRLTALMPHQCSQI